MKNFEKLEQQLFNDGCYIDCEFITDNGYKIRLITTVKKIRYRLTYVKNSKNVFTIYNIEKVR
jgi:hypothetical protein